MRAAESLPSATTRPAEQRRAWKWHARFSTIGLAAIATWAAYVLFAGGAWWVQGNIHDLFMALPTAHFFGGRAGDGSEFHTSFGWIYPALHEAAWWLMQHLPRLDLGALPLLTGIVFGIFLLGLYGWVRAFSRPWLVLPWWGAALLLTLVLTTRHLALRPPIHLLWYSLYNHHLWACWLLQLLLVLGWVRRMGAQPTVSDCPLRRLATLQTVFLYVGLHYKISFFLAAGGLVLAPCCFMPWRASLRYLAWTTAFFLGSLWLTALAGYDYAAYLNDLLPAFHAKQHQHSNRASGWVAIFFFLCFAGRDLLASRRAARESGDRRLDLPAGRLCFALLVLGSAWTASMGNFFQVPLFVFVAAGMLAWMEPQLAAERFLPMRLLRWALLGAMGLAVALNLAGMAELAWHRTHAPSAAAAGPRIAQRFVSRSGAYNLNLWLPPESAAAFPEPQDQMPEAQALALWHKEAGEPTPFGLDDTYNNRDYARFVQQGQALLEPMPGLAQARIGSLEFGNPFPLLAEARYPTANQHWFHPTTTHDWQDMGLVVRYYASSDLLLMPTANSDGLLQNLINCHFLRWNIAAGHPFRLVAARPYVLLYAARAWQRDHPFTVSPPDATPDATIAETCGALETRELGLHPSVGNAAKLP